MTHNPVTQATQEQVLRAIRGVFPDLHDDALLFDTVAVPILLFKGACRATALRLGEPLTGHQIIQLGDGVVPDGAPSDLQFIIHVALVFLCQFSDLFDVELARVLSADAPTATGDAPPAA